MGKKYKYFLAGVYTIVNEGEKEKERYALSDISIFTDTDRLFLPIFKSGCHWALIMIMMKEKKVMHYDSLHWGGEATYRTIMKWLTAGASHHGIDDFSPDEWSFVDMREKVPKQPNSNDCAIYTMMFADYLSDDLEFTFSADVFNFFREKIAADIIRGRLTYSNW